MITASDAAYISKKTYTSSAQGKALEDALEVVDQKVRAAASTGRKRITISMSEFDELLTKRKNVDAFILEDDLKERLRELGYTVSRRADVKERVGFNIAPEVTAYLMIAW